jgi:acyl carrier protein
MTGQEIRVIILDAMKYANVNTVQQQNMVSLILDGREDIALDRLEMDSLAVMELCIALEERTGVTVVPDDLERIATLNRLVRTVQDKAS